ncbi:hypothetical protein KCU71_g111, partial [Aureobasidium melanogenum]
MHSHCNLQRTYLSPATSPRSSPPSCSEMGRQQNCPIKLKLLAKEQVIVIDLSVGGDGDAVHLAFMRALICFRRHIDPTYNNRRFCAMPTAMLHDSFIKVFNAACYRGEIPEKDQYDTAEENEELHIRLVLFVVKIGRNGRSLRHSLCQSVASSEVLRDFFVFNIGHGQNQHKERSEVVVFVATISPVLLVRHGLVGESVEAIKEELVEVVQRASPETGWPFRSSGSFSGDLLTFECFGQEVCRPGKNAIEVQNYRHLIHCSAYYTMACTLPPSLSFLIQ